MRFAFAIFVALAIYARPTGAAPIPTTKATSHMVPAIPESVLELSGVFASDAAALNMPEEKRDPRLVVTPTSSYFDTPDDDVKSSSQALAFMMPAGSVDGAISS
ncbi:hypothetical protein QCA50_010153 [Cerrena zonata]|uniref:Uncharacterized protein n=1 Tax=Cerrena zonata TaxID=2478898 RepID=A0AAW0G9B6_9APHY